MDLKEPQPSLDFGSEEEQEVKPTRPDQQKKPPLTEEDWEDIREQVNRERRSGPDGVW